MVRQKAFVVLVLGAVLTACSSGAGTSAQGSAHGAPSAQPGLGAAAGTADTAGPSNNGSAFLSRQPAAQVIGDYLFRDHETHQNPAGAADFEVTFHWILTLTGYATFKLYGSVAAEGTGSMSALSCTGGLSAASKLSSDQIGRLVSVYSPGDSNIPQTFKALVGMRSQLPWKNYYLVIGGVPGIDAAHVFVSSNTNPAETNCNTDGMIFFASPSAGSTGTFYSSDQPAYAFFDKEGNAVSRAQEQWHWQYTGPVDSPPGYQDNVTEKLCEDISFERGLQTDGCIS